MSVVRASQPERVLSCNVVSRDADIDWLGRFLSVSSDYRTD